MPMKTSYLKKITLIKKNPRIYFNRGEKENAALSFSGSTATPAAFLLSRHLGAFTASASMFCCPLLATQCLGVEEKLQLVFS